MTSRASASGLFVASAVADQNISTVGATGIRTATVSFLAQLEAVLVALRPAPTVVYLQHDQLGSTRLLTAPNGSVVGTYAYTPYGATITHTGQSTEPPRDVWRLH
jgi:hypothetical protein